MDLKQRKREYMRKYNATPHGAAYNRKHVKEWRKRNKKPHGARKARAHEYRELIIDSLIKRDGLICGICGSTLEGSQYHIDHRQPVALGGPNTMDNVQLTHPKCNMAAALTIRKQALGY